MASNDDIVNANAPTEPLFIVPRRTKSGMEHTEPRPLIMRLIQAEVEKSLLGEARRYTRAQVAERAGVTAEYARTLWRALGFASPEHEQAVLFTESDVDALRTVANLENAGLLNHDLAVGLTRALGQMYSRTAEWQLPLLNELVVDLVRERMEVNPPISPVEILDDAADLVEEWVPVAHSLQTYVWRRHLAARAARYLAGPGEDTSSQSLVVGFADMVGFTDLTRLNNVTGLAELLESFESTVTSIIANHSGSVIKNVGDEIMFSVEQPASAARIALELHEATEADESLPLLHVGLAYGEALARYGDLYGSVVNTAARLTSAARGGDTLVDGNLAEILGSHPAFTIKAVKSARLRRFMKYRPHSLRWAKK
ncbi:adenylate/guanylate cyclase domain-containing protein [Hoyosella sp. YIM 151337]|uniref:adenylate/guanylate cyclase domain-containing protein n=1 Tax=Hoyosella sp. YIM 151337 TaxID=2992742 RepID=UPI0022361C9A|nr:adenylate/guanylate cyclase domain-containing protein [Hoyosella sp. YIM 151337]MCW4353729.1 adenylate/guanylate cyclase domain-containing protein [Hoyosella sp. YIM 151337]